MVGRGPLAVSGRAPQNGTDGVAGSFRGTVQHKVDAKGRVSVPASFRRALEQGDPDWSPDGGAQPRVIIVTEFEDYPCITCMTLERMDALEAAAAISGDPDALDIFEIDVVANSDELKLDDNGRMVLGPELRREFDIGTEAAFVGRRDRFEIWRPESLAAYLAQREADPEARARRRAAIREIRVASARKAAE